MFYEYAWGMSIGINKSGTPGHVSLNWIDEHFHLPPEGSPPPAVRSLPIASTSLDPKASWQPMNYLINGTNGQFSMDVDTFNPHMFFRLKRDIASDARFAIRASVAGNGSMLPAGPILATVNQNVMLTAVPNPGYGICNWFLDGQIAQWGGTNFNLGGIDDEHTVVATILPINDLKVSISLATGPTNLVSVGTNFTFVIKVANLGLNPATGVNISGNLPPNLGLLSVTYSQGKGSLSATNLTWFAGKLPQNGSATATVAAVALTAGPGSITAAAIGQETEADLSNNQATANFLAQ